MDIHLSMRTIRTSSQPFCVQDLVEMAREQDYSSQRGKVDSRKFGYIAWAYEMLYAQKEVCLEQDLPPHPPEGWESLKSDIISSSTSQDATLKASGHEKTGVFIIICEERSYYPPSMDQNVHDFLVEYLFFSSL